MSFFTYWVIKTQLKLAATIFLAIYREKVTILHRKRYKILRVRMFFAFVQLKRHFHRALTLIATSSPARSHMTIFFFFFFRRKKLGTILQRNFTLDS